MLRTVLAHMRAQWAGFLALFLVLAGGVAYAANTVFSTDIVNGEVKSADIGNNQVQSADVRDDSLPNGGLTGLDIRNDDVSGADVIESTLQGVDASTVGGLQIRKINFQVGTGTGPTTVLNFGGLQITAECQTFGDILDVKAFTSKDNAIGLYFGGNTTGATDTNGVQDIASTQLANRDFDIGDQLQIDDASPILGDSAIGTLNYSANDGSVVVVQLALDEIRVGGGLLGCALTGTAIGG